MKIAVTSAEFNRINKNIINNVNILRSSINSQNLILRPYKSSLHTRKLKKESRKAKKEKKSYKGLEQISKIPN
jgi:hypothetical protein